MIARQTDFERWKKPTGNAPGFSRTTEDTTGRQVEALCVRIALYDEQRRTQSSSNRFRILEQDATETFADESRLHKQRFKLRCSSALKSQRVETNHDFSALQDAEAHVLGL